MLIVGFVLLFLCLHRKCRHLVIAMHTTNCLSLLSSSSFWFSFLFSLQFFILQRIGVAAAAAVPLFLSKIFRALEFHFVFHFVAVLPFIGFKILTWLPVLSVTVRKINKVTWRRHLFRFNLSIFAHTLANLLACVRMNVEGCCFNLGNLIFIFKFWHANMQFWFIIKILKYYGIHMKIFLFVEKYFFFHLFSSVTFNPLEVLDHNNSFIFYDRNFNYCELKVTLID